MNSKEEEYKEIFLAEALDNHEELNRLLTQLEKEPTDKNAINAIFRITHTLKGNALGMGFDKISELSHVLEDLFGEIRNGSIELGEELFTSLFKALDTLGELINSLKDNKEVRYKGIKTKLEVLIKRSTEKEQPEAEKAPEPKAPAAKAPPKKAATKKPGKTVKKQTGTKAIKPAVETKEEEIQPEEKQHEETKELPKTEPAIVAQHEEEEPKEAEVENKITFSDLVQVPVRKLDNLLNLVGELIIERDRIIATHKAQNGNNEYARLNRISSDLQYSVMDVRLVQVGFLFNKFHRVVRDAASSEQKKVVLKLEGTETEIDRNILQIISDSLIHLIRNAVGHGVERPEERQKKGKPKEGTLTLSAQTDNDAVVIKISDDGAGIDVERVRQKVINKGLAPADFANQLADQDVIMFIFEPGFSTMDQINSISGRGVGMDVVKKALDSVGGNISVETNLGTGTTFSLRLPSSMAVKGTLLFELQNVEYAIPLSYTEAVVSLFKSEIHKVGNGLVATHLGRVISIVFLKDLFQAEGAILEPKCLHRAYEEIHPEAQLDIIIVSFNNRTVGFVVDKLLQQREIVEKPLMKPVDKNKYIGGVTILGNGNVCLVLNVANIINTIFTNSLNNQSKGILS